MKKTYYYFYGNVYRTIDEIIDETGVSKYSLLEELNDKNETNFERITKEEYDKYLSDLIVAECEAFCCLIRKLQEKKGVVR